MIMFVALLVSSAAVSTVERDGPEYVAARTQAQTCVAATVKGDVAKVIDLTHPKLVAQLGGRKKAIERVREARDKLERDGVTYVSGEATAPDAMYRSGGALYCVIPVTYRVKAGEMRVRMKSPFIGVSADGGRNWTFFDTSRGEAVLRKLFPEIPKELKFPADEEPVVEPNAPEK